MKLEERKKALVRLGLDIKNDLDWVREIIASAYIQNKWFTTDNSLKALNAIAEEFLNEAKLDKWLEPYSIPESRLQKVGLVLAGNIPLVGWHDILCTFIAGHGSVIKCSSKDEILVGQLIHRLAEIDPATKAYFELTEIIKDVDAVIATGGDTAATHFKLYFGKYPHIIRKNRSSIAILSGSESDDELFDLMDDVFTYFGMGCRSVSKIYIPQDFNTDRLFEASLKYADVIDHSKYKNNFEYSNAIYLLGQQPFLTNNFLILLEDKALSSRISCLHFERYSKIDTLQLQITEEQSQIQCISSNMDIDALSPIALGACQKPGLSDYADGVDTLQFLIDLSYDQK